MNFYYLIGGLGLFLYGMSFLEDSLKSLAGRKVKQVLERNTDSLIKSILTGIGVTAILQSSSLVGLLTLTFVGAGVFTLHTAFGIILGANLGTTITGWLFNFLGFKLSIENLAWSLIGMGGLALTLLSQKYLLKKVANFFLAFGLLFIGLNVMKDSISVLASNFDFSFLPSQSPIIYFIGGMLLTAIIQSSSATMVITMSALSSGIINFQSAVAFVMGADLGTTSTVLLGMIGGSAAKKRVAISHFMFNFVNNVLGLIFISFLIYLVRNILSFENDLTALVACHTTLNIFGILVFIPFINPFIRYLENSFLESEVEKDKLDSSVAATPGAIVYIYSKIKELIEEVFLMNSKALQNHDENHENIRNFLRDYENKKRRIGRLTRYVLNTMVGKEDPRDLVIYNSFLDILRETNKSMKGLKDIADDIININEMGGEHLKIYQVAKENLAKVYNLESLYSELPEQSKRHELIEKLIYKGLQEGVLSSVEASTLLNVFTELEWSSESFQEASLQMKEIGNEILLNKA